jgi:phosphoglycerol transferase
VTIFPVYSLLNYWAGVKDEMSDMMPQLPSDTGRTASTGKVSGQPGPQPAETAQQVETGNQLKKNIIIIYAEGFEQLYFDQEIFGDIVPNLRKLSGQAYRFTNAYQVRGATWTIAGIVASQCGFPLVVSNHIASNSTMASIDKPFENEECLADILLENGYKTVFMGGDPNSFAGRGNFLRTHGYQEVLGYGELIPLLADQDYTMGWGLYDDSLFGLAYEKLETLEAGDSPYLLVLSTLDTHHPEGHPSKSCQRLSDNDDPISNAVYCSDQLISKFIKSIMELADMDETVIVLFSDHLAMRNSLWAKLRANKGQRRLTWMMFDNQPAGRSNRVATHFDFAPTLLDKSGISGYSTINQGVSLLTQQDSRADGAPPEVDIAQAPRPLGSDYSVRKSGFRINYSDLTIIVGDLSLKASENGWRFTSGLYLVVFDEEGNVIDTIHSVDFARLVKELNGRFVVGISIHEKGSEHDNQFFFGRVTNDLTGLSVRKLDSDVTVDASQLNF